MVLSISKPKSLKAKKSVKSKLTSVKAISIINNMKEESDMEATIAKKKKRITESSDEEDSSPESKIENGKKSTDDSDETKDDEDVGESTGDEEDWTDEEEVVIDCADQDGNDDQKESSEEEEVVIDCADQDASDDDQESSEDEETNPFISNEAEEMDEDYSSDSGSDPENDNLAFQAGSCNLKAKSHPDDENISESSPRSSEDENSLDDFIVNDGSDESINHSSDSDEKTSERRYDLRANDISKLVKRVPKFTVVIANANLSFDVNKMSDSCILKAYGEPLRKQYRSLLPLKENVHANQENGKSTVDSKISKTGSGSDFGESGRGTQNGSKKRKLWEFSSDQAEKRTKMLL